MQQKIYEKMEKNASSRCNNETNTSKGITPYILYYNYMWKFVDKNFVFSLVHPSALSLSLSLFSLSL
jgi:hypothetical protein